VLLKDVQQDHELHASPIQDPVERPAIVAPQLAKFPFDLGAMRKGKVRVILVQEVHALDLPVYGKLNRRLPLVDEVVHRLATIGSAVELRDQTARSNLRRFCQFALPSNRPLARDRFTA
jgi:hypothetical protein